MLPSVAVACTLALALAQDPQPPVEPSPAVSTDTVAEGPALASEPMSDTRETSAIAPPKWRGDGLLIASGVLGGLGLASNIGRIALVQQACKQVDYDVAEEELEGTAKCRDQGVGLILLTPAALAFNVAALGTGATGGSLHGSWAAHDTAIRNGRRRARGAQIGVGAGLLTLGVLGYVAVRAGSFADGLGVESCNDKYPIGSRQVDALADCIRHRWSGYLVGIMLTQAAAVAGGGILAHGVSYSRNLKLYRTLTNHQVRLSPSFTPTWAGLSLSARF